MGVVMTDRYFCENYTELVEFCAVDMNGEIHIFVNTDGYTLSEYPEYEELYNFIYRGKHVEHVSNTNISEYLEQYEQIFKTYDDAVQYVYLKQFVIVEDEPYNTNSIKINGIAHKQDVFKYKIRNMNLKMLFGKLVDEVNTWYGLYRKQK